MNQRTQLAYLGLALTGTLLASGKAHAATITNFAASNNDSQVSFQYKYSAGSNFYQIFIDLDKNASTGYLINGVGADYVIENNSVMKFTGSNRRSWSWTRVGSATYSATNGVAKFTVDRSLVGMTNLCSASDYVVGRIGDSTGATVALGSVMSHALTDAASCSGGVAGSGGSTTNPSRAPSSLTLITSLPAGYSRCAYEWMNPTSCNYTGSKNVIFGISGKYYQATFNGPFNCNTATSTIGDPNPGVGKECYIIASSSATPTPTVTPTPTPTPSATPVATPTPASSATPSSGSSVSANFTSTSAVIPNPDRGYAGWVASNFGTENVASGLSALYNTGNRLGYCTIDIANYRTSSIPTTFLSTLQTNFNSMRSAGLKCVILVAYGVYSGSGNDGSLAMIKDHLAALGSVFKNNADVISFAKAGMVGAYGEWWGSQSGHSCGYQSAVSCPNSGVAANRAAIRDAVLNAFPSNVQVEFRYPDDLVMWYPTPITADKLLDGSGQSRTGMHNDCQLSANNDTGTWVGASSGKSASALQSYVAEMTKYVSYGGEVSQSCNTYQSDCASALSAFSKYHLSWIKDVENIADAAPYKSGWSAGGCLTTIKNTMGYRLQLDSINHQGSASAGQAVNVTVNMRNVGWSRLFSARPLVVQLCNGNNCYSGTSSKTALVKLDPQATSSTAVTASVTIPSNAPAGTYQVRLSVPDVFSSTANVRAFKIRFANGDNSSQSWNDSGGYMTTGTSVTVY